jgi:predicted nucleic acid-binding protein
MDGMQPPSQLRPGASPPQGPSSAVRAQQKSPAARSVDAPLERVQAAFEKGLNGLAQALYANQKTSDAILSMVNAEEKIGSAAKAATFATAQVIEKLDIPERVAVPMVTAAADEVMQMAEEANIAQYSEEDAKNVVMASAEMMLQAYGVDATRAQELAEGMDPESKGKIEQVYAGERGGNANA